jgi:hypothetical protein
MTNYGKLYNYGFDSESPRYNWARVDTFLFGKDGDFNSRGNPEIVDNLINMIQEQFDLPLQNVWRVHVLNNGLVELNDFTLPTSTGKMRDVFKQEDLPLWVQDSLSVLMIVDQGVTIEGLGKKISDSIFYIVETPEIGEAYGNKA